MKFPEFVCLSISASWGCLYKPQDQRPALGGYLDKTQEVGF